MLEEESAASASAPNGEPVDAETCTADLLKRKRRPRRRALPLRSAPLLCLVCGDAALGCAPLLSSVCTLLTALHKRVRSDSLHFTLLCARLAFLQMSDECSRSYPNDPFCLHFTSLLSSLHFASLFASRVLLSERPCRYTCTSGLFAFAFGRIRISAGTHGLYLYVYITLYSTVFTVEK